MTIRNGSLFTNLAAPCRHRLHGPESEEDNDDDDGHTVRAVRTRKSIKAAESEEGIDEPGSDAEERSAAEEDDGSEF